LLTRHGVIIMHEFKSHTLRKETKKPPFNKGASLYLNIVSKGMN
jgi:hypothetical protein